MRLAKDDFDGLRDIVGHHLDDTPQAQREISVEAFFEARKGANIAARRGICVNTRDTLRKAAFRTRRDSMTTRADVSTAIDLPDWYGGIEDTSKRDAATQRRRASSEKVNRSNFEGDRSNFEGDRSNFEGDRSNSRGDREKNERARDLSVAFTIKS